MAYPMARVETPQPVSGNLTPSAAPRRPEPVEQPVGAAIARDLHGIMRRAKLDIGSLRPYEIRILHQTIGNQAVARLLAGAGQRTRNATMRQPLQAKLTIGGPDDAYEKEADTVAQRVMSGLSQQPAATGSTQPELRRKCACGGDSEEECSDCRMQRLAVQRLSPGGDAGTEAPAIVEHVLATPGQPLAEVARNTLEPAFGHDFGDVRVHHDPKAAESAAAVNAHAYTVGHHIVFGQGQYAPDTSAGQHLLAHELTHTIQQTGGITLGSHVARIPQTPANRVRRDSDTPDQTDQPPAAAPADHAGPAAASPDQAPDSAGAVSLEPIKVEVESQGPPVEGGCDGLRLHGSATPDYRRSSTVENQAASKADGCDCPKGVQCLHVTGTRVTNYSVTVAISMPSVPSGLTPCERAKVRDFLNNVLKPHELDHKAKFETYNGQTRNPLDITACGRDGINQKVGEIQEAENKPRQAAAQALSDALDPFQRTIDCSGCQKQTAAPGAGQDAASQTEMPAGLPSPAENYAFA